MTSAWDGIFSQDKMKDDEGYVGLCHPLVMDMMWRHRKDPNMTLEELISTANIAVKERNRCKGTLGAELTSKSEVSATTKHALVNNFKRFDPSAYAEERPGEGELAEAVLYFSEKAWPGHEPVPGPRELAVDATKNHPRLKMCYTVQDTETLHAFCAQMIRDSKTPKYQQMCNRTNADVLIDWEGYRDDNGLPFSYLYFFVAHNPSSVQKQQTRFKLTKVPTAVLFYDPQVFPLGQYMMNATKSGIWSEGLRPEFYCAVENNQVDRFQTAQAIN